MAWENILRKENLEIRCDKVDKNIILEVNNGGISCEYITLHMGKNEVDELIQALTAAKEKVFPNFYY